MAWAGLPSAMQALQCPALQRGGRRGGLRIAGEAVHDRGWDRGPASEPSLERRHGGDSLWLRADPEDVRLLVLRNRRVDNLREEGRQGVVPADDRCQARILCGDAITTHAYLLCGGWREAVPCVGVGGLCGAGAPGTVRDRVAVPGLEVQAGVAPLLRTGPYGHLALEAAHGRQALPHGADAGGGEPGTRVEATGGPRPRLLFRRSSAAVAGVA